MCRGKFKPVKYVDVEVQFSGPRVKTVHKIKKLTNVVVFKMGSALLIDPRWNLTMFRKRRLHN